jgi:hypothetical protein
MSAHIEWTDADFATVSVLTAQQANEEFEPEEPVADDLHVLALGLDVCSLAVIEGSREDLTALLERALATVKDAPDAA